MATTSRENCTYARVDKSQCPKELILRRPSPPGSFGASWHSYRAGIYCLRGVRHDFGMLTRLPRIERTTEP
jgi:hypothetical protein